MAYWGGQNLGSVPLASFGQSISPQSAKIRSSRRRHS
jgi:hypothetical protein